MASKVRINLQIEDTSPLVREIIGSLKGEKGWTGADPDEVVKVTYVVTAGNVEVINEGIYYSIPTITTAKEGDTAFSDDFRLFVYDEVGARWRLWASADKSGVKVYHNNTLIGDGSLEDPLSVNTNLFSLKGDINPLLEGTDNGDGTYTFTSKDGNNSFTIDLSSATGGVQSVTGDGVDSTDPNNPVLSFPDADEVDDSSTTNKFVTQALINLLNSAVQPGDLATVATTGDYNDLMNVPGPTEWGDITGTLSDQLDLNSELNSKADQVDLTSHTSNTSNPHSVTKTQVGLGNVDNTSDASKPVSTAQQLAINQAESNANIYTDNEISKLNLGTASQSDVGDFATSAQGALADTAVQPGDLSTVATSGDYDDLVNTPTLGTAAAADVGDFATAAQGNLADSSLQSGDNISELANDSGYVNALQAANAAPVQSVNGGTGVVTLDSTDVGAIPMTQKGSNGGVAELDVNGYVPASQLPSFVDDVIEVADYASLPGTGESGKIYITIDDNLTYRWGGSAYVLISSSLALGETSSTAYRGDRGKIAYDHSQLTSGNPHNVTKANVGLGNVDNTSDVNKPISTAVQNALNGKFDQPSGTTAQYIRGNGTLATFPTIPNSLDDLSGDSDDIQEGTNNLFLTTTERNKLSGIASGAEVNVNADWNAVSGDAQILNKPTLGTAAAADTGDFATAAQGSLAGTALQPGDNVSDLTNDSGYVDAAGAASAAPVQSVNSQTGSVVLDADDIDDTSTTNKFVTAAEKSDIASAIQPGDLATVATTGAYSDLSGTPTLATVATTGAYSDLTGTPAIPEDSTDLGDTGDLVRNNADTYNSTPKVLQVITVTSAEMEDIINEVVSPIAGALYFEVE